MTSKPTSEQAEAIEISASSASSATSDTLGAEPYADPSERKPVLTERILQEMEAFQERVAEFGKALQSQMSKQRSLLEAMQREKQRYLRWREEHSSHRYDLRSLSDYLATVYMPNAQVKQVEGMGRGVFAVVDLAPGDIVIAEEPLIYAENTEDPRMQEALGVFVQSWQVLRAIERADPSILPVFLAQVDAHHEDPTLVLSVQKAQAIEFSEDLPSHSEFSEDLPSHSEFSEDLPCSAKVLPEQEGALPKQSLTTQQIDSSDAYLRRRCHWLGILQSNAFSLHLKPRKAVGVFPAVAMLNHSCQPNASSYNEGTTMIVQACVPIAKGQEIMHSYLSRPQSPVQQRQTWLRERFGFTCRCAACLRDLVLS